MDYGEPAFPAHGAMGEIASLGMSLRDYFAAKAMVAITPIYAIANGGVGVDHLPANVPILAYRLADAMLAERAK